MSQAGLEPVIAGASSSNPVRPRRAAAGQHAFIIDAGRAFGTGHHETTSGCTG